QKGERSQVKSATRPQPSDPGQVTDLSSAVRRLAEGGAVTLCRAPEGYDAFIVAELARALAPAGETRAAALVFVARDGMRAQAFSDALAFAAPEIEALHL